MRYLTLFTDANSWVAMDGRVIPANEVESVSTAAELAQSLSQRLQEANEEIEQKKQAAKTSGYEAGYKAGLEAAKRHNDQQLSELQTIYAQQNQQREAEVVDMALAIVKRIAGNIDSDAWLIAQATEAVGAMRQPDETVRLVVHRSQVLAVQERLQALKESSDVNALRIDSVEPGDEEDTMLCRLEVSVGGSVMVDLPTQLASIERALNPTKLEAVAHG